VRAYNQRLLDFARDGGHLVVQYNKVAMNQLGAGAAGSLAALDRPPHRRSRTARRARR
jgi:hypothetical protein